MVEKIFLSLFSSLSPSIGGSLMDACAGVAVPLWVNIGKPRMGFLHAGLMRKLWARVYGLLSDLDSESYSDFTCSEVNCSK